MSRTEKYRGIFPAFYACYEDDGRISGERAQAFTKYLIGKGVQGLYVGGSSGECIYQSVEERKELLENVMEAAGGKLVVIAHVACNNTKDSVELAAHAQSLGVDAIASIPPIYFHLPEYAIAEYWNAISAGAPDTDFIIYNIPQLAGVSLTLPLLQKMRENPRVIGVKNSSMPVQDIQIFQAAGSEDWVVFNGPDEQFVSGRAMGAAAGIGGTYAAMPELYLAMDRVFREGRMEDARTLQYRANEIIGALCSCRANMYAVIKELLRMDGMDIGGVRPPLVNVTGEDLPKIRKCREMIDQAISEPVCRT
mgnify:CR=1 FL=1